MSGATIHWVVAATATLLGMIAGRVFAIEGGKRVSSVFAAAYVGAGVGLLSSILLGSLLSLIAQYVNAGATTWFDALDVAGTALLWGTLAGAVGGLTIGAVITALPSAWLK